MIRMFGWALLRPAISSDAPLRTFQLYAAHTTDQVVLKTLRHQLKIIFPRLNLQQQLRFVVYPLPSQQLVCADEIWRFLAWQAARTPGWMELEKEWARRWDPNESNSIVEPPPPGLDDTGGRARGWRLRNIQTGENLEVSEFEDFKAYRSRGWEWILTKEDKLELIHLQAWYFQVRHFPRLQWTRLTAPDNQWFITSDRAVSWIVDGYADTPPAALRHPTAQVFAPLTKKIALIGRYTTDPLCVTPHDVNQRIACATSGWVAGPTRAVIEQAIHDRAAAET